MRKNRWRLPAAILCGVILAGSSAAASSEGTDSSNNVPSYVEIPKEGDYTMDGESKSEEQEDGSLRMGTDFYLYIEKETEAAAVISPPAETEPSGGSEIKNEPETEEPQGQKETEEPQGSKASPSTEKDPAASGNSAGEKGSSAQTVSGKLPKTGDYGMDKNMIYLAALGFGVCYLICDAYEKKKWAGA